MLRGQEDKETTELSKMELTDHLDKNIISREEATKAWSEWLIQRSGVVQMRRDEMLEEFGEL